MGADFSWRSDGFGMSTSGTACLESLARADPVAVRLAWRCEGTQACDWAWEKLGELSSSATD